MNPEPADDLRARLIANGASELAIEWRIEQDPARRVVDPVAAVVELIRRGELPAGAAEQLAAALQDGGRRWCSKSAAARLLGVTVETVRGRCSRRTDPIPTTWRRGRELVDIDALADDLRTNPPRRPSPSP